MSAAWRFAISRLSPAGRRARLSVLIFHRVLPDPDHLHPGEPTAAQFEQRLRWIKARFNVISLAKAVEGLKSATLPERALSITFDDGYADNHDLAAPVLAKLGMTATFFIATGYLDGGVMFNDIVVEAVRRAPPGPLDLSRCGLGVHDVSSTDAKRAAICAILQAIKYKPAAARTRLAREVADVACAGGVPRHLMMTGEQVGGLRRMGMDIGAHTVSHPILADIDASAARREISEGRERLESLIRAPIELFAYPNGEPGRDYGPEHVRLVRELRFKGAVSTARGAAWAGSDPFQIPRFTPWDWRPSRAGTHLVRNLLSRPAVIPAEQVDATSDHGRAPSNTLGSSAAE
jgi:peptidoglycan/xylan/chitin deacetylase (PgdA/CDA1 family)